LLKKLPEQLGLNCYAVSTHSDKLIIEPPPPKKFLDPPMLPLHTTGYGGLLSESLNHVWASQAMLTMYEIEKETK